MALKEISNDNERTVYADGHVSLSMFHYALNRDGYTAKGSVSYRWMVETTPPDDCADGFSKWFEFCNDNEPGAFPVTCATV
ncbi:hypothetical protein [Aeromonas phage 85AhydR10PP]|nr:hypothetical protein [Aeromonas phage 85AhydR10PP]